MTLKRMTRNVTNNQYIMTKAHNVRYLMASEHKHILLYGILEAGSLVCVVVC